MNARRHLRRLALASGLCLFPAALLIAQTPPPAPAVTVDSLTSSGDQLGVNLFWQPGSAALPGTATLMVTDSNGEDTTSLAFVPQWGPQTVWIPGVLATLPTDSSSEPLRRSVELVVESLPNSLLSFDLEHQAGFGPILLQAPKWCYLHLIHIECLSTEDTGPGKPDEVRITSNYDTPVWAHSMNDGQGAMVDQWFCLGPKPGAVRPQTIKIWEAESFPNPSTLLGTLAVTSQDPTGRPISRHFTQGTAHYFLTYEVRCSPIKKYPC